MVTAHLLFRISALLLFGFISLVARGGIKNGDFEQKPNTDWLREGPNAPRVAQGDRPAVGREPNGNRHGHAGDANGAGANGENTTRIFQRFDCGWADSIQTCVVSFRYRLTLARGEVGWVRMNRFGNQTQLWLLPNTNGNWAGPVSVGLFNCGMTTIEFGLSSAAGGNLASVLDIDDVTDQCIWWAGADLPGVFAPYPDSLKNIPPPITLNAADGEQNLSDAGQEERKMNLIFWMGLAMTFILIFIAVRKRRRKALP